MTDQVVIGGVGETLYCVEIAPENETTRSVYVRAFSKSQAISKAVEGRD
jgi:hypothetical protein